MDRVHDVCDLLVRRQPQAWQALKQKLEGDPSLQPGERRTDAEVDAVAKREVALLVVPA